MTIPDIRDMELQQIYEKPNSTVGYLCATIICCAMLYFDGVVALTAAGAVAGAIVGIKISQR